MSQVGKHAEEWRPVVCPRCGATFGCGAATGDCWCFDEAFRLPVPVEDGAGCYCPDCLRAIAAGEPRVKAKDTPRSDLS